MKKRILILGGTNFIGRNIVESLLETNKYEIILFNRGITNPELFPDLKKIKGDRYSNDINFLKNNSWDFVIDVSCFYPENLEELLEILGNKVLKYIYISTCSVYELEDGKYLLDEESKTKECRIDERNDNTAKTYGKRKSECERIIKESKLNYVILRPSLVYGLYDNTDRFYYWLYQIKNYEEILIPGNGEYEFSVTYVKDIVNVTGELLENVKANGIYNVVSSSQMTIFQIIEIGSKYLKKNPTYIKADPDFLKENEVREWLDIPLWINGNYFTFTGKKLLKKLKIDMINFEESVKDTIAFYNELNWPEPKYGMIRRKQISLIKKININKWHL